MSRYVLRRLGEAVPLLVLVTIAVFVVLQVLPGGPLATDLDQAETALLRLDSGKDVQEHVDPLAWDTTPHMQKEWQAVEPVHGISRGISV